MAGEDSDDEVLSKFRVKKTKTKLRPTLAKPLSPPKKNPPHM